MKTKLTILLLAVCTTMFAQQNIIIPEQREPITVQIESKLKIMRIDSIGGSAYFREERIATGGETITLVRPVYLSFSSNDKIGRISYKPYEDFNYSITNEGFYVLDNSLRTAMNWRNPDYDKYGDWFLSFMTYTIMDKPKPQEQLQQSEFEQKQARLQAQMKTISQPHKYVTIFTGDLELNFSHQRLLDFLREYMNMGEISNEFVNGKIVSKITERTAVNQQKTLTVTYTVRNENNLFFPTRVEITGTPESVISFFVFYYPTKINSDERTPGTYISYMLPDKITLTIDSNGGAKIVITSNE